jgi:hypothetical protein
MTTKTISWPEGRRFAFTVFDDTDGATLANVKGVYDFLADSGLRTTKSAWVVDGDPNRGRFVGQSCDDPDYRQWVIDLQRRGFEIGFHNCTWHGLPRDAIRSGLDKFAEIFGHDPVTAANHCGSEEGLYFASARLSGWRVLLYNLVTRFRNYGKYRGHIEGDPHFWGDLCRARIKYYRNFIFRDINTLKACPIMPYHDPKRPYVNYWFASSDGANCEKFSDCVSESAQDRLEEEGGACIMYTHLARGFLDGKRLKPRFQSLVERLAKKNGWFVPVGTLLDYLLQVNGPHEISDLQRRRLETKWLWEKLAIGTD